MKLRTWFAERACGNQLRRLTEHLTDETEFDPYHVYPARLLLDTVRDKLLAPSSSSLRAFQVDDANAMQAAFSGVLCRLLALPKNDPDSINAYLPFSGEAHIDRPMVEAAQLAACVQDFYFTPVDFNQAAYYLIEHSQYSASQSLCFIHAALDSMRAHRQPPFISISLRDRVRISAGPVLRQKGHLALAIDNPCK